tara:strand:- start:361 stop:486 length:126 start_codon:yes stop_codon:yes gene_type:complete
MNYIELGVGFLLGFLVAQSKFKLAVETFIKNKLGDKKNGNS